MAFNPGGGGGSLATSSDVTLSNITNGQILSYDQTAAKWKNASSPANTNVNIVSSSTSALTLPSPSAYSASRVTLDAACTLTFPAVTLGASFVLTLVQGSGGNKTVTWPSSVKWAGGVAPSLSVAANAKDALSFFSDDGSTWLGFYSGQDMR